MSLRSVSSPLRQIAIVSVIAFCAAAIVLWFPTRAVLADQPGAADQPPQRNDDRTDAAEPAAHTGKGEMKLIGTADDVQWKPGPDALPEGAQYAVLEGDPEKSGYFTLRLKLPADYRIPPHTHPQVERVTVLSGKARLGMGREFSESSMRELSAGAFFTMPIGMEHFVRIVEPTVVQLNGMGPWDIVYVNPQDDPRKERQ